MTNLKTIKCWGIPYGNGSESITIEMKVKNVSEFKKRAKEQGHTLTSKPYISPNCNQL